MNATAHLPEILAQAQDVEVRFGGSAVLERVSLTVRRGEIVTLIGPNGSGKSTLVRTLLGLIKPDRGRVFTHPGIRIGYMPQRLQVDPVLPLSVRRFLTLGVRATLPQVQAALEEVGAAHVVDRPIQDVSGGELQRVLLARALLREPDLLVLDEPVQGVDVNGQHELYELITRIRTQRGCGILMVSHDLHLVMAATDHVVCLNRHVCCAGRPETVSRDPAYLALFGPTVARGLAFYQHRHDHVHGPDGILRPAAARPHQGGHSRDG